MRRRNERPKAATFQSNTIKDDTRPVNTSSPTNPVHPTAGVLETTRPVDTPSSPISSPVSRQATQNEAKIEDHPIPRTPFYVFLAFKAPSYRQLNPKISAPRLVHDMFDKWKLLTTHEQQNYVFMVNNQSNLTPICPKLDKDIQQYLRRLHY